jgi:hypothetical protein
VTAGDRPAPRGASIGRGALLLVLAAMRPSEAAAPFQTDDPEVLAPGRYELLVFYRQTLDGVGRRGALPGLEAHYGAMDRLELDLVAPVAFDMPSGQPARRGYGDTELGLKYRLLAETETMPLISIAPKLDVATGNADRGLGSGGVAAFLPVFVEKNAGPFRTYGGGGYWINRGADNRNYWFFGAEAEYHWSERWATGVELFHTTPRTRDERSSTGFDVGGAYAFAPRAQLLFSLGKGLQNASQTNRVSSYLGVQMSY